VVTVLEKDNFLLRYDLEDVVRLNETPCPCGETHRRLFYEGRVRDLVAAGSHEVLPIDVALVLYEFPEVSTPSAEYQIVRPSAPSAELHVRCEHVPGADPLALAARIADRFRERLGVAARIELVPRDGAAVRAAARVVDA
jgi:phenylacetate-CoA ligase